MRVFSRSIFVINCLSQRLFRDRYPPYTDEKIRRLIFLLKKRELPSFRFVPYVASFALGVASMILLRYVAKVTTKSECLFLRRMYRFAPK